MYVGGSECFVIWFRRRRVEVVGRGCKGMGVKGKGGLFNFSFFFLMK